jgi:hypothetical protein
MERVSLRERLIIETLNGLKLPLLAAWVWEVTWRFVEVLATMARSLTSVWAEERHSKLPKRTTRSRLSYREEIQLSIFLTRLFSILPENLQTSDRKLGILSLSRSCS